jgi:hypothetical protein
MKRFEQSVAGRLLTLAVALPLTVATMATWSSKGYGMVWIIASIFAAIILSLLGIGLAIGEYDREAVAAVLFLPPALLLYTPLVGIASGVSVVRVAMGMVAGVLLATIWHDTAPQLRFASPRNVTTRSA